MSDNRGNRAATLGIAAFVVAVLAALGWWVARDPVKPPPAPQGSEDRALGATPLPPGLSLPDWDVKASELLARWESQRAAVLARATDPDSDAVLALFRRTQASEWAAATSPAPRDGSGNDGPAAHEIDAENLRAGVFRWTRANGPQAWMDLGWRTWPLFHQGLDKLRAHARTTGAPLGSDLDAAGLTPDERLAVGDFALAALSMGILREDGSAPDGEVVIGLAFRYRWAAGARHVAPLDQFLPPDEHDAFLRWRILRANGFPVERRIQMVSEHERAFGAFGDVPSSYVRAVLYASHGRGALAAAQLRTAAEVLPERAAAWRAIADVLDPPRP